MEVRNSPPISPDVRVQLGQAIQCQQQGDYPRAERLFRAILERDARQPVALHYLGLLAHQTGRDSLAEELLRKSLALAPANSGFYYNFAGVLAAKGRGNEAVPQYQRALELNPGDARAWHGLALTLRSLEHPEDAVECWLRCLKVKPDFVEAWLTLAETYQSLGLLPEELDAVQKAYALDSRSHVTALPLARALSDQGRYSEASELVDSVISKEPDMAFAYYDKGVVLTALGQFFEAEKQYAKALSLAPDYFQVYVNYVAIKKFALDDPVVKYLESRAVSPEYREADSGVNVNFALGKIYQDHKQYPRAFEHFRTGNRLYRGKVKYSTESQRRYFDEIRKYLDADFMRRNAEAGDPTEAPVFIVGMPRSGTTLVEQILAGHPQVHARGELTIFSSVLRRRLGVDFRLDFARSVTKLAPAELLQLGRQYLSQLQAPAGSAARITDKMPSHFVLLGLIHVLFPKARIIHCRRDPLDTCVSCFTTLFKNGQAFSYDLRELGEYYRLYEQMMAHWRELLPEGAMLEVEYEQLIRDPGVRARELLEYCGLPWDPACLEFSAARRAVSSASAFQVRQPLYSSSVGRWRAYAEYLGPLQAALGDNSQVADVSNT